MAYGDVKENFGRGVLNEFWYYIELCGVCFPERDGETIDKLKESLIRYSLIRPWPLPEGSEPDTFVVKFFANEYADFHYYLGLGQGLELGLNLDKREDANFDLEGSIIENCLKRAPKKDVTPLSKEESEKARKEKLAARSAVIDYLEAMGDVDKPNIIRETGASVELIDGVLRSLRKNGILKVNKRNQVVSFNGDAARRLLLED